MTNKFLNQINAVDLFANPVKANILTAKIDSPFIPDSLNNAGKYLIENGLNLIIGFGWIAGGAIVSLLTGQPINDLDLYFTDQASFQNTKNSLISRPSLKTQIEVDDDIVIKTQTSIGGVDLIKKDIGKSVFESLDLFDFFNSMFAIDTNHNVYWTKDGLEAIEKRELRIHNPKNILTTMLRIQKYAKKGFLLSTAEALKLINEIKLAPQKEIDYNYTRLDARKHHY